VAVTLRRRIDLRRFLTGTALLLMAACGPRITVPPEEPTPPAGLAQKVAAQAKKRGPSEQVEDLLKGASGGSEGQTWHVTLRMRDCYLFSVASEDGVEELQIDIFNPEGKVALSATLEATTFVEELCITNAPVHVRSSLWKAGSAVASPGSYRIEARVSEGRGHYLLGVFKKLDTDLRPDAKEHPEDAPARDEDAGKGKGDRAGKGKGKGKGEGD
jgi:hypothetical protein